MSLACRLILVLSAWLPTSGSAGANDYRFENSSSGSSLIELYTSEGCSSCPPAEAWLSGLKNTPGLWKSIFPVAFHITYWDDLGWTDPFAQPAFTQRQRDYASRLGQDSVYTPEFIVNGREWRGWFHSETLHAPAPSTQGKLSLILSSNGPASVFYAPPGSAAAASATLTIASLMMDRTSDVAAGENAGKHLHHDFLVVKIQSLPMTRTHDGFSARPIIGDGNGNLPAAVVSWVMLPNGEIAQVTGGWTSSGH
jgi:hypothetical protein